MQSKCHIWNRYTGELIISCQTTKWVGGDNAGVLTRSSSLFSIANNKMTSSELGELLTDVRRLGGSSRTKFVAVKKVKRMMSKKAV